MSNPPLTPSAPYRNLSPGVCKVLDLLLTKGSAYHVRGAWRFRGSSSRVREPTLRCLLAMGLAECVENDNHTQLKITEAGRTVNSLVR